MRCSYMSNFKEFSPIIFYTSTTLTNLSFPHRETNRTRRILDSFQTITIIICPHLKTSYGKLR